MITTTALPWYYYAGPTEYYCRMDPNGHIPSRFRGPYESRAEAIAGYREWKLEQMENEDYEAE